MLILRVLVVHHQEAFREGLALALRSDYGFDVTHTATMHDAAALIHGGAVDAVITGWDPRLHPPSDLFSLLDPTKRNAPVIFLAEHPDDWAGQDLSAIGIHAVVFKRESIGVLATAISGALHREAVTTLHQPNTASA